MAVRGTDFKNEIRDFDAITKEKKVEGQEIKAVPLAPRRTGQVVDIFAALKKSWRKRSRHVRRPPPRKNARLRSDFYSI
jgi:non-homologous end joining protein Ku